MKNEFRYILEKGSKKHRCPECGKKTFVRYIDRQKDAYLSEEYGRCDREVKCGYFLNPYEDGLAKKDTDWRDMPTPEDRPTSFIDPKLFKASLKGYGSNIFVQYLHSIFDAETVRNLTSSYRIGTSKYWKGATVFWQVDESMNVRTGKIMLYRVNGHRKKSDDYNYITWVHALNEDTEFNLEQCLFGAHLIPDSDKPVAVVESEKTAIIASGYLPEFTWLATGALHNLKPETCKVLAGRSVVLFPDLGAFGKWQQKATDLAGLCDISVSNYLQTIADAEAQHQGYDLADYLIRFDPNDFTSRDKPLESKFDVQLNDKGYPTSWDDPAIKEAFELEQLCERDPLVKKMIEIFDAEITTPLN